jgi:hypothetical protein
MIVTTAKSNASRNSIHLNEILKINKELFEYDQSKSTGYSISICSHTKPQHILPYKANQVNELYCLLSKEHCCVNKQGNGTIPDEIELSSLQDKIMEANKNPSRDEYLIAKEAEKCDSNEHFLEHYGHVLPKISKIHRREASESVADAYVPH